MTAYSSSCHRAKVKTIPFAPGFKCLKCGKPCMGVPFSLTPEEYRKWRDSGVKPLGK